MKGFFYTKEERRDYYISLFLGEQDFGFCCEMWMFFDKIKSIISEYVTPITIIYYIIYAVLFVLSWLTKWHFADVIFDIYDIISPYVLTIVLAQLAYYAFMFVLTFVINLARVNIAFMVGVISFVVAMIAFPYSYNVHAIGLTLCCLGLGIGLIQFVISKLYRFYRKQVKRTMEFYGRVKSRKMYAHERYKKEQEKTGE